VNGVAVALPTRSPAARVGLRRALRSRSVELSLGLTAVSGLLLWEVVGVPWAVAAPVLVAHVLGGAALLAVFVAPFWIRHRTRLRTSREPRMRWTGRLIEVALLGIAASGLYLFVVGNRGEPIGRAAEQVHLWLTFPLAAGLALHLARGRLRARRPRSRAERPIA